MEVTVTDVLQLEIMAGARLLAGLAGIKKNVEFIDILESPGGIRLLKPNDMLVTTIYPVLNDEEAQKKMMWDIYDIGVSMLCIKVGRYIEQIPEFMIALADDLELPLVELPATVAYADIIHAVSALIIGSQAAMLRQSLDINKMFTSILKQGGTLDELTHALSDTICCPVIVEDVHKKILSYAYYPIKDFPSEGYWLAAYRAIRGRWEETVDGSAVMLSSPSDPSCKYALVRATYRSQMLGSVLAAYAGEFDEINRIALENAASFISLALATEKSQMEKEATVKQSILNDLLHGNVPVWDDYSFWFKQLNINTTVRYLVFLIRAFSNSSKVTALSDGHKEVELSEFDIMLHLIHQRLPDAFVHRESAIAAVILPESSATKPAFSQGETPRIFFEKLLADLSERVRQLNLHIAIGGPVEDIHHLSQSYDQAAIALKIGQTVHHSNISFYSSVQIYDIFAKHPDPEELKSFCRSMLSPLIDNPHIRFDAITTLETYLGVNGSLERSASTLYMHVSTVKYRINRIKETLGLDLEDAEYRLRLNIALMIYRLLLHDI